jgi:hypothetical protein
MCSVFYIKGMVGYIVNFEEDLSIPVFLHQEVVWKADDQIVPLRSEEETIKGVPNNRVGKML